MKNDSGVDTPGSALCKRAWYEADRYCVNSVSPMMSMRSDAVLRTVVRHRL
jgi:hypothetical protein